MTAQLRFRVPQLKFTFCIYTKTSHFSKINIRKL